MKMFENKNVEYKRRKKKAFFSSFSISKIEFGRSTRNLSIPTIEHFHCLRVAFKKILHENLLSKTGIEKRILVFNQIEKVLLDQWPGLNRIFFFFLKNKNQTFFLCLFNLEIELKIIGSTSFDCCLEKPGILDLDLNSKEKSKIENLREIFEVLNRSGSFVEK